MLTGRREHAAIQVMIDDLALELRCTLLEQLLDLILTRAESDSGYVAANPTAICRLRHAIDAAVGTGVGAALIETGVGQEYRLAITRECLSDTITLTPCFFELVERGVATKDQADRLRKHFSIV